MKYRLRHFENNLQMAASLGWMLVIIGVVFLFVGPIQVAILCILLGVLFIWLQLRGKRITVDTQTRIVRSGGNTVEVVNPTMIFMNEVRVSQNVNSRVNTANVKMYFYKAYIQDGENRILISCNRNDERDMEAIRKIATDLNVPFQQNY